MNDLLKLVEFAVDEKNSSLKSHLKKLGVANYEKGCPDIFKLVGKNDGFTQAIANSKKLKMYMLEKAEQGKTAAYQLNPFTQIHHLFQAIDDFLGR